MYPFISHIQKTEQGLTYSLKAELKTSATQNMYCHTQHNFMPEPYQLGTLYDHNTGFLQALLADITAIYK